MEPQKEHPLTAPIIAAVLAVMGLWGLGITMIDQHKGIGIFLCLIGIMTTVWIFSSPLKATRWNSAKTWPMLAIVFLTLEVGVLVYMLYPTASELISAGSRAKLNTKTKPTIEGEFSRARVPSLGNPAGVIEETNGVYQASHERAMVFSLLPVQTVYALPKDTNRPAVAYHYATIDDDRKWWDDKFLREKFKTPQNKKPPEYRVAELWDQRPDQLKWIGWREWSCPFKLVKFYYQKFEHGIIFGVFPTSETLGSSQTITVVDGGKWSAIEPVDQLGAIEAPACNEKSANVNGVVIHGHHVKP